MNLSEFLFLYKSWKFMRFASANSYEANFECLVRFCKLYVDYSIPDVKFKRISKLKINSNFTSLSALDECLKIYIHELRTKRTIDHSPELGVMTVDSTDWLEMTENSAKEVSGNLNTVIERFSTLVSEVGKSMYPHESGETTHRSHNLRCISPLVLEAREILNLTLSLGDSKYAGIIKAGRQRGS